MPDYARIVGASIAGAAALSAGALAYGVRVPSCSWLAPSLARGAGARRSIALTFDDGPSESTPELLEILARYGAAATFFQIGANARRLPDIAREIAAAGHEIGNHTETHPMLSLKSSRFIAGEIAAAQMTLEAATGVRPRCFRAPYGVRWFGLAQAQRRLSLIGVTWSTIALDWKLQTPAVVSRLIRGAMPGAILCLHDGRVLEQRPDIRVTIQAVRDILPKLIDLGFRFEKVSDILCPTKS